MNDPKLVDTRMLMVLQGCKHHSFGKHLKAIVNLGEEPCSSQIIVP